MPVRYDWLKSLDNDREQYWAVSRTERLWWHTWPLFQLTVTENGFAHLSDDQISQQQNSVNNVLYCLHALECSLFFICYLNCLYTYLIFYCKHTVKYSNVIAYCEVSPNGSPHITPRYILIQLLVNCAAWIANKLSCLLQALNSHLSDISILRNNGH